MPGSGPVIFVKKPWKSELALLAVSTIIYFIYFHHILLHLNSLMSSVTSDTLKNYYTYAFQIRNGASPLHFSGMNFPYGEHVVFTDCQPLLTMILQYLPFAQPYSIGILHALIFISFILTPLVLRRIFLQLQVAPFASWCCALGLALLSPQFQKMNAGHFALSYTIVIPLGLLILLRAFRQSGYSGYFLLLIYTFLLFLLHPYLGSGLAIFCLLTVIAVNLFQFKGVKRLLAGILAGILPVLLFRIFITLTDEHAQRTAEPYGLTSMVENTGSILAPEYGPFKNLMEALTPQRTMHFEGHTYIGFINVLLLLLLPFVIYYLLRRKRNDLKEAIALMIAALAMLFLSFGWHHHLLSLAGINIASVNQFRAVSRFAWFFYYGLGIFLVVVFSRYAAGRNARFNVIFSLLYLSVFAVEANFLFRMDQHVFWKWPNIFQHENSGSEQSKVLSAIRKTKAQAIVPLPIFHIGSEMYERSGENRSMLPAMIYSYHSGLPILSCMASRTSVNETEDVIGLLNPYKTHNPARRLLHENPLLLIKTTDRCMPDEERLWSKSLQFLSGDSISYGVLEAAELTKPYTDSILIKIPEKTNRYVDREQGIWYLRKGESRPFTGALMKDLEVITSIDAGTLKSGRYVLSFHYHYAGNNFRDLSSQFVLAESADSGGEWLTDISVRKLSGFYSGFGVFEHFVELDQTKTYILLFHGLENRSYFISDLMIRRDGVGVFTSDNKALNNFPP